MDLTKWPMAGQLTNRIQFFENTAGVSDTGVANKEVLTPLGQYYVNRIDGTSTTDEDGRLADVAMVIFRMRFVKSLFAKGGSLVIRDFDGDYNVKGPFVVLGGRNRYMQCKAVRRA